MFRSRVLGLVTCSLILFFMMSSVAQAENSFQTETENWANLAKQVMEKVDQGDYLGAKERLATLANQFIHSNLADKRLTVEGIHELAEVMLNVERQLNRITPDVKSLRQAALRMQLAFDALSHPNQPMWLIYYDPLKKDVTTIQQALQSNQPVIIHRAIVQTSEDYYLIRSALVISKSPSTVEKIDSVVIFIQKTKDPAQLRQAIDQLNQMLQPLFFGAEKDVMAVSEPWNSSQLHAIMLVISACIAVVLTYVGWRKYRAYEATSV